MRVFSTGSQYADWSNRNCDTCKHQDDCNVERRLFEGYLKDGEVSESDARIIGFIDNREAYTWDCPEWSER